MSSTKRFRIKGIRISCRYSLGAPKLLKVINHCVFTVDNSFIAIDRFQEVVRIIERAKRI